MTQVVPLPLLGLHGGDSKFFQQVHIYEAQTRSGLVKCPGLHRTMVQNNQESRRKFWETHSHHSLNRSLAHSLAHSLAPLNHSLAPHCSHAPLCSLIHSRARGKVDDLIFLRCFFSVLDQGVPCRNPYYVDALPV